MKIISGIVPLLAISMGLLTACVQKAPQMPKVTLGPQVEQTTQFDLSEDELGATTRWLADNGKTLVRFEGKDGEHFRLAFERDGSQGEPLKMTFWVLQNGQTVRSKSGGVETTFTPHDCSLTIGRCIYMEANSRLGTRLVEWNATRENGLWSYTVHAMLGSDRKLLEQGTFTVDPRGYYIDQAYSESRSGVLYDRWTKRLQ